MENIGGPIKPGETFEPCIRGGQKILDDPEKREMIKRIYMGEKKTMTTEEYEWLKEELSEVLRKIEVLKSELNPLYLEKKRLQDLITGHEGKPVNTTIEYLFSKFDDERSREQLCCAKSTVTRAKKFLLESGYTDLKQLEGKQFTDFFESCDGIKVLAVILAYCIKCDVKMNMVSASHQDEDKIQSIKYEAIRYTRFIVF